MFRLDFVFIFYLFVVKICLYLFKKQICAGWGERALWLVYFHLCGRTWSIYLSVSFCVFIFLWLKHKMIFSILSQMIGNHFVYDWTVSCFLYLCIGYIDSILLLLWTVLHRCNGTGNSNFISFSIYLVVRLLDYVAVLFLLISY